MADARRVEEVFKRILDNPPDDRVVALDELCRDDASLRAEVFKLIAADLQATGFLEPPNTSLIGADPLVGASIGRYRVRRLIATGGMGRIYEATQHHPERRVALKALKASLSTGMAVRRFIHEGEILGRLEHPGIAQVIEAGTHGVGPAAVPYLVMEFVDGEPITDFADRRRFKTIERLRLFQQVCAAVHYAHQSLIVHRDLKPSNILVTPDGTAKLVDFGIAKLLDEPGDAETALMTQPGMNVLTPAYASPEQIRGEPVTTASDTYSLGVILYELLTGHRPYRFETARPADVERVVCEREPIRPSTAIGQTVEMTRVEGMPEVAITPESVSSTRGDSPHRLRRRLSGDLDNIVLMALRKEPARRYPSAQQLSDDIGRHLDGMPVIARKDTITYRASKFVRRHRVSVLAGVLITVSLAFAAILSFSQARVAARERDAARAEQAKAERVTEFLQQMLASFDPGQTHGPKVTIREILDEAARRADADLADQPEVQAAVRHTLGETYYSRGYYDEARTQLEAALRERRRLLGDSDVATLKTMNGLARVLQDQGKLAEAELLYRHVLDEYRRQFGIEYPSTLLAMNNLGWLLWSRGQLAEAESLFRQSLTIRQRVVGPDDRETLRTMINLAGILRSRGKLREAEPLSKRALERSKALLGSEDTLTLYAMRSRVTQLTEIGALADAEALARHVLELDLRILGEEHPYVSYSKSALAGALLERGQLAEAERLYRNVLAARTQALGSAHPETINAMNNLGACLLREGKLDQAAKLIDGAFETGRMIWEPAHPDLLDITDNVGRLRAAQGHCDDAVQLLESLRLTRINSSGLESRLTIKTVENLAAVLIACGRAADAETLLQEAINTATRVLAKTDLLVPELQATYGQCLFEMGRTDEAVAPLTRARNFFNQSLGPGHARTREAEALLRKLNAPAGATSS